MSENRAYFVTCPKKDRGAVGGKWLISYPSEEQLAAGTEVEVHLTNGTTTKVKVVRPFMDKGPYTYYVFENVSDDPGKRQKITIWPQVGQIWVLEDNSSFIRAGRRGGGARRVYYEQIDALYDHWESEGHISVAEFVEFNVYVAKNWDEFVEKYLANDAAKRMLAGDKSVLDGLVDDDAKRLKIVSEAIEWQAEFEEQSVDEYLAKCAGHDPASEPA
ncbi:hypothetical protein [Agrococcus casei]|uniref:hypothetical protein n=1 Tax=Agrococcus casei TaxID=343512 RepID=UPI003F8DB189